MFPRGDRKLPSRGQNAAVPHPPSVGVDFATLTYARFPQLRTLPQQLHLNVFPYKATKYDQPVWSDSLKFIGP